MEIVLDLEANGLQPTVIHCIVCLDYNRPDNMYKFVPKEYAGRHLRSVEEFPQWYKDNNVTKVIAHHGIGYDFKVLKKLLGLEIPPSAQRDTLVESRMADPVRGGGKRPHSVEMWGERLGLKKPVHEDWSKFSFAMLQRCTSDCIIQYGITKCLDEELEEFSEYSRYLEHEVTRLLEQQRDNGFYLDRKKALGLHGRLEFRCDELLKELRDIFPREPVFVGHKVPRFKKDGTLYATDAKMLKKYGINVDQVTPDTETPIELWDTSEFDPSSHQQVAARLKTIGWSPTRHTDKGAPQFTEDSIVTLSESKRHIGHMILEYRITANRKATVSSWLDLADEEGYVHGSIISCGARTHRASHRWPNMSNPPRITKDKSTGKPVLGYEGGYGFELRSCWIIEPQRTQGRYRGIRGVQGDSETKDHSNGSLRTEEEVSGGHDRGLVRESSVHAGDDEILRGTPGTHGTQGETKCLHDRSVLDTWTVPRANKCGSSVPGNTKRSGRTDKSGSTTLPKCYTFSEYVENPRVLVGADASGIQLRALAHYAGNEEYIKKVSDPEVDIHSVHQHALGLGSLGDKGRAISKTFIYAWLLGAGLRKIGLIITEDKEGDPKKLIGIGKEASQNFYARMPFIKTLKDASYLAARRGYMTGLDGRRIVMDPKVPHKALSVYLQSYEAIVMKQATVFYHKGLWKHDVPFWQRNFVHDELQVETLSEHGDFVGDMVVRAIVASGKFFKSKCPLDGEYKLGYTWAETH